MSDGPCTPVQNATVLGLNGPRFNSLCIGCRDSLLRCWRRVHLRVWCIECKTAALRVLGRLICFWYSRYWRNFFLFSTSCFARFVALAQANASLSEQDLYATVWTKDRPLASSSSSLRKARCQRHKTCASARVSHVPKRASCSLPRPRLETG